MVTTPMGVALTAGLTGAVYKAWRDAEANLGRMLAEHLGIPYAEVHWDDDQDDTQVPTIYRLEYTDVARQPWGISYSGTAHPLGPDQPGYHDVVSALQSMARDGWRISSLGTRPFHDWPEPDDAPVDSGGGGYQRLTIVPTISTADHLTADQQTARMPPAGPATILGVEPT